jgi:16S rRNA (cytosine1407-C5)-methyltransferase
VLISRTGRIFDVSDREAEALLSFSRRQSVRINPLASRPPAEIEKDLAVFGAGLRKIEWIEGAYHLDLGRSEELPRELFDRGELFIQNASSFLPVLALEPKPGERILDLCASPGGKSSLIAALTRNAAELWLNDGIATRLPKLKEVVELLHVRTHSITAHPGQFIDRHLDGPFDNILIDAQCTGEGMIDLNRRESYRYWSYERVQKYSMLQRKMLIAAHKLLKPGGVMVYSTCTFSPEENEVPVAHLLKHRSDMRLESIDLPVPELIPARRDWNGQDFGHAMTLARRVKPSTFLEGFFLARLRKAAG